MENQRVVIFDFDGTLADSAPLIRAIYTEMAKQNNWKVMTDEDYEILRRGSIRQARVWAGIRWWQLPNIIRSAKKLMKLESEKVVLFPGMLEIVKDLNKSGYKVYILSRNLSDTIKHVLDRHDLHEDVEILNRRKRSFGSKGAVIRKLLRDKKYDKNQVWMVGDEVRDLQAARTAGVKSIAVGWGIQDLSILERCNPTCVATDVKELRTILEI